MTVDIPSSDTLLNTIQRQEILHIGYDDIKSSCGTQVDSRKSTAPNPSFGTSVRPKLLPQGDKVPGPGAYQIPSSLGKAITTPSAPACAMSGREKFGSTTDLKEASNAPGPGDYSSRVVNPNEQRAPKYSLGKRWPAESEQRKSPGPGSYEQKTLLGRVPLSTKQNAGQVKFGKGKRPPLNVASAADTVGPGQYRVANGAVGKQSESTRVNAAAFSFSAVGRKKAPIGARMNHDKIPGPGEYKLRPAVGKQVESTLRSAPKCSMSGRTKFGSHF